MTDLLLLLLAFLNSTLKERRDLALENLSLRQQLAVLKRSGKRLAIKKKDRVFWVWLSRIWREWRESLAIVKPVTVIGWHRKNFRLYWTKLSRRRYGGRPAVDLKIKALIEQMAVVYVGHSCGLLCGGGGFHVLQKKDAKWAPLKWKGTSCSWAS